MARQLITANKLLALLGITDTETTTKIVLTIEPDSIPTVEITKFLVCEGEFAEYKEMFELVSKETSTK